MILGLLVPPGSRSTEDPGIAEPHVNGYLNRKSVLTAKVGAVKSQQTLQKCYVRLSSGKPLFEQQIALPSVAPELHWVCPGGTRRAVIFLNLL